MKKEKLIKSERIYKGRMIGLRKDFVMVSRTKKSTREICEHPGAVAVLAVTIKNEIILVRQYRRPTGKILLEIPAGLVNHGETLIKAAEREFTEETGYNASRIVKTFSSYSSPGYSTEMIHFYFATGLTKSQQNTDEDEIIEVELVGLEKCLKMIKSGKIKDNKSIAAILFYGTYAKLY